MAKIKHKYNIVTKLLLVFLVLIVILHIGTTLLAHFYPENFGELNRNFDLDSERNVPTLYSSLILGMCAFACVILSFRVRSWLNKLVYYILGGFFFYVAFDESLIIHETSAEPIRDLLGITDGNPLYHAWIIPAILVVLGLFLLYKFIRNKSPESKYQKKLVILVSLLGAGVITLEILGTLIYVVPLAYKLGPVLVEEVFEIGMVSYILSRLSDKILMKRN